MWWISMSIVLMEILWHVWSQCVNLAITFLGIVQNALLIPSPYTKQDVSTTKTLQCQLYCFSISQTQQQMCAQAHNVMQQWKSMLQMNDEPLNGNFDNISERLMQR